eukprot:jgi/Bigna1/87967/estExt_fgenesh1_pg.C_260126
MKILASWSLLFAAWLVYAFNDRELLHTRSSWRTAPREDIKRLHGGGSGGSYLVWHAEEMRHVGATHHREYGDSKSASAVGQPSGKKLEELPSSLKTSSMKAESAAEEEEEEDEKEVEDKWLENISREVLGQQKSTLMQEKEGSFSLVRKASKGHRELRIPAATFHKVLRTRRLRQVEKEVNPWTNEWQGKIKQILLYNQTVPFLGRECLKMVPQWESSNSMVVSYEVREITPESWSSVALLQHRFHLHRPGRAEIMDNSTGRKITVNVLPRNDRSKRRCGGAVKIYDTPVSTKRVIEDPKTRKIHVRIQPERASIQNYQNTALKFFIAVWNTVDDIIRWAMNGL